MSFDEAIGMLAIGNIFGELEVIDLAGGSPEPFGLVENLPPLKEVPLDAPSFSVSRP